MENILVIGASGQIETDLVPALAEIYGEDHVYSCDIKKPDHMRHQMFIQLDVTHKNALFDVIRQYKITQVYHLAALLSATGEKDPLHAWDLNMRSLLNVLELGKEKLIKKIYWPSSIAVFGRDTPKRLTPQFTVMNPTTVYGISKVAGERWCAYYHENYGIDVRSLRYPGLIGYKSMPGGGTTDYAVEIYHKALETGKYECFLDKNTYLPMMYMPDAIRATIQLMEADRSKFRVKSSYNVAGISFSPEELASFIKRHIPEFTISYKPDFRQGIADTWPQSLDDSYAHEDWGWKNQYTLSTMTKDMIEHLKEMKVE
jgi:nucleoside-diphosphate-sugar epimerase